MQASVKQVLSADVTVYWAEGLCASESTAALRKIQPVQSLFFAFHLLLKKREQNKRQR